MIENYFPDTAIKYLVNTHNHPDHFLGNSSFQDACIIAHSELKNNSDIPVNIFITSETVLNFGDKTFEIHFLGNAHTNSDLVIFDHKDNLLIMGDLLCRRKSYIIVPGSDTENWINILGSLIERKNEYKYVIPGHGGIVEDVSSLIEQQNYLKDIWSAAKYAMDKGLTLKKISKHNIINKYKDYMVFDRIGLDIKACWEQMKKE